MRHYEIVFLVQPDQSEQVTPMLDKYSKIVKDDNGTIHRTEDWGRRVLSYPINNFAKAHYALMNVECTNEALDEIKTAFKFNDVVIRNLIIRKDEAVTAPSTIMSAKKENRK